MRSGEISSIGQARGEFLRKESPWALGAGILVLVVLRGFVGDFSWRDGVAVAAMLAIYPFGEWAIHVYLLHARPMRIRGREIETVAARAHRAHHGDPDDLDMVLLYWWQAAFLMLVAVPLTIGIGVGLVTLIAGPVPLSVMISAAIAGYCMVFVYEWTHFLIHTSTSRGPGSTGPSGATIVSTTSRTSTSGTGSRTISAIASSARTPTSATCRNPTQRAPWTPPVDLTAAGR